MIYVNKLRLPSDKTETGYIVHENRTCFNTVYPFKIFPDKGLSDVSFDSITMLYGGNGSGKSTLINVLAEKINAVRFSEFNVSPLFDTFVGMCEVQYHRYPKSSTVLTSDDVFDYVLNARSVNERLDEKRDRLFDKYVETKNEIFTNPEIGRLKGLDDYERWAETREILSPRRTQSSYVKKRVVGDVDLFSNGETSMRYFMDKIDNDGIYLLDEPENSLSIEFQIQLAEYIMATACCTSSQFIIATHSPVFLSMKGAMIYNLDSYPVKTCKWTTLPNVRKYFDFFMEHKAEFTED